MLASVLVSISCLIALQVLLVVRVADWLSTRAEHDQAGSRDLVDRSAGRYAGIA